MSLLFLLLFFQLGLVVPQGGVDWEQGRLMVASASSRAPVEGRRGEFYATRHQHDHHEHFDFLVWKVRKNDWVGNTDFRNGWKIPYLRGEAPRIPIPYRREGVADEAFPLSVFVLIPHDRPG